nr:immunoglobulin heavy chain junction region [Mus musculus]MBK4184490.1 immunoglobulin heavy chain junction region [Mus musculus]
CARWGVYYGNWGWYFDVW